LVGILSNADRKPDLPLEPNFDRWNELIA